MTRVLVACEFSSVVRRAFAAKGYDAWSKQPSERVMGMCVEGGINGQ